MTKSEEPVETTGVWRDDNLFANNCLGTVFKTMIIAHGSQPRSCNPFATRAWATTSSGGFLSWACNRAWSRSLRWLCAATARCPGTCWGGAMAPRPLVVGDAAGQQQASRGGRAASSKPHAQPPKQGRATSRQHRGAQPAMAHVCGRQGGAPSQLRGPKPVWHAAHNHVSVPLCHQQCSHIRATLLICQLLGHQSSSSGSRGESRLPRHHHQASRGAHGQRWLKNSVARLPVPFCFFDITHLRASEDYSLIRRAESEKRAAIHNPWCTYLRRYI